MASVPSVPIFRSLKGSCIHSFVIHHLSAGEKITRERSLYGGGGKGGTWVNFGCVCAAGLSEPLPHYSLFCGQLWTPSWSYLGRYVIFAILT